MRMCRLQEHGHKDQHHGDPWATIPGTHGPPAWDGCTTGRSAPPQTTVTGTGGARGWAGGQQWGHFHSSELGSGARAESGPSFQVKKKGLAQSPRCTPRCRVHPELGGERQLHTMQHSRKMDGKGRKHCSHGVTPNSSSTVASPASCSGLNSLSHSLKPPPHHTEHPSPPPSKEGCHGKAKLTGSAQGVLQSPLCPHLAAGGPPRRSHPPAHR